MNEKLKNYLGAAIIITLLLFAISAVSFVFTYSRATEPSSFRSFNVSGEGKAVSVPDIAQFSFSVITEGTNIADLQRDNAEKMNRVISYVKSNGVDKEDIRTQSYSLVPQYSSCFEKDGVCPPPTIQSYTISQSVTVKIRDFSKVSTLLAGVVSNGANSVSDFNFTIDDPSNVENEAREEAISKAQQKAQDIADAGGFRLGRLLSIEEGNQPIPYYLKSQTMSFGRDEAAPAVPPSIEPGSQEVTVSVTLRYEIR